MEEHPTFVEIYENSGLASTQFNCHSYAWYNASVDNPCWIRYPDEFIGDPHCFDITNETDVQEGDIVVFYNGDVAVHSAKVDSITYQSGDWIIECVSKFHDEGIYLHNIDETSDVYTYDDYKFYRYTQGEHFLSIDEDNGESGHTFVCTAEKTVDGVHKTCSYTTECDGEFTVTSVNSSYHRIYCSNCYYSEYVDHDLYMYSAAPEDYVVKCHDCSYTVECWESPEYYGNSDDGHSVSCPDGCYSFYEPHTPGSYANTGEATHDVVCDDCGYEYSEYHTFGNSASSYNSSYHFYQCVYCGETDSEAHSLIYSDTDSLYTHSIECRNCNYQSTENHNWIRRGTGYLCTICGQSEAFIPSDVMSLSDEELSLLLSSMSEEERAEFVASLPEDAVARVTAILPRDDEHLTE